MLVDHFGGMVARKRSTQELREEAVARCVVRDRNIVEIAHCRIETEFLKGMTRTKSLRRPIELRIGPANKPEKWTAKPTRKDIADALFVRMERIAAIACEKLVSGIAR